MGVSNGFLKWWYPYSSFPLRGQHWVGYPREGYTRHQTFNDHIPGYPRPILGQMPRATTRSVLPAVDDAIHEDDEED